MQNRNTFLYMTNDALKQTACDGIFLQFHLIPGSLSGDKKSSVDRDRTRTCNPQIRSLMPYPLGHTAQVEICRTELFNVPILLTTMETDQNKT